MKFKPYERKTSVTCLRTDAFAGKKLATLSDETDGQVLFEIFDTEGKIAHWCRMNKEDFFGMIGSLWPNEVAIIEDEDE